MAPTFGAMPVGYCALLELDAGVDAQIVKKLHAAPDHPVLLSFPEGLT